MANISLLLFDRDGVLNQNPSDNGYVLSPSELVIYPEVLNQIAKLPKEIEINDVIAKSVVQAGGKKLEFFVCPHLATLNCDCRKPKPGLIFQAMSRFSKQPHETLFIGDKETDEMAAHAAKVQFASTDSEVKTKAIINRLLTTKG